MKTNQKRFILLGVEVDPVTIEDLHAYIGEAVDKRERWVIVNHNLHSIYLYHRDPKMRRLYEIAKVIHIDGMPLLYWGRLLGYSLDRVQRVTYLDWVYPLMTAARLNHWRIYYLGGKPGVAKKAAQVLRDEVPGLQIDIHHGYFLEEENPQILDKIARYQPHILMVGMGMPRQEHWILNNLESISANAVLCSGACFDYVAGAIHTPPRWMGQVGIEWLHRLSSDPGRLAKRYLIEPWFLLQSAVADVVSRPRENGGKR